MVKKRYHKNFIDYMKKMVNNPIYKGLPGKYKKDGSIKWVVTANSMLGKKRQRWINEKAKELNIKIEPGSNAKVALQIHPTKHKPCQICGKEMSLYYIYPGKNFINYLNKKYNYEHNKYNSIYDIISWLENKSLNENTIKHLLIKKGKVRIANINKYSINAIVNIIEKRCRNGNSKLMGPGAMSDYPDRLDGFHSYNRCCRARSDKGRHRKNLESYNKDRRAYEYWSDGNINAADKFMKSNFFKNGSADHIGPISLGFVHDPHFFQKMNKSKNSAKRDRLNLNDFYKLISIEQKYKINASSWFINIIWSSMKYHVKTNNDLKIYRRILKLNMIMFMECLYKILHNTSDNKGKKFLTKSFLLNKMKYFKYDYKFNKDGSYTKVSKKKYSITKQRLIRVSLKSIDEYHQKNNRKTHITLNKDIQNKLNILIDKIDNNEYPVIYLKNIVKRIQLILIKEHHKPNSFKNS